MAMNLEASSRGSFSRWETISLSRQAVGLGGVVFLSFLYCYAHVFVAMASQWWSNDIYSYGFVIPLIACYLIWIRREKLSKIELRPNYAAGCFLLFSGLFSLVIGQAGGILTLQEVSLMITLPGIVLFLWGTSCLRILGAPIAYLWFMIPIWEELVTDRLHFPLQNFSAYLGGGILQAVGIPVFQEGIYIHMHNRTLEVARACSGVNYVIAVVAIGIPMAIIFLDGWKRRLALICFAVGVAVLSNSLRVALIGLLSFYGFEGPLHGPLHVLQGMFVSVMGYGAIFAGLWALSKKSGGLTPRWHGEH